MAGSESGKKANKTVLAERIAQRLNLPRRTAMAMLDGVLDSIEDCLVDPRLQGVALKGFGTFEAAIRKGRAYRHPKTHESIHVEDKPTVKFKPAHALTGRLALSAPSSESAEAAREVAEGEASDRSDSLPRAASSRPVEERRAGSPFGESGAQSLG